MRSFVGRYDADDASARGKQLPVLRLECDGRAAGREVDLQKQECRLIDQCVGSVIKRLLDGRIEVGFGRCGSCR